MVLFPGSCRSFPVVFYGWIKRFSRFFLTACADAAFYVSVWKFYVFLLTGFHPEATAFFLADWFDNGLVFHLRGSGVLPEAVMWSLFDVNGSGKWNGRRV